MATLYLTLPEADADRLAELAAREGVTPEEAATAAVKARLNADAADRREVEAGLAELDSGAGMTLEAFEREMDAFMAEVQAKRA